MSERSVITCPTCGFAKSETMPKNACQFFYECEGCDAILRPKAGDCCVFCSYGSTPCPPVQVGVARDVADKTAAQGRIGPPRISIE
jgi:hypothetical protein